MFLTRLAVHRPLTVLMGLLGIVLMGAVSYTYLKVDRLPPLSIPFVSVNVSYPNASAEDVEALVVRPIEDVVSGIEGVQQITSQASEGRGSVNVQLAEGADANAAAIEVTRRLAAVRNRLPADAGEPTVNRADPNSQPILNVALTGAPLDVLYDLATTQFQPQLQSVVGVAQVNITGGLQREIQVQVDYAKLSAYGVTLPQIQQALNSSNVTAPVGSVQQGARTIGLRATGRFQSVAELENLVVAQTTGGPVLLRNVATVREAYRDQTQLQRLNGQDAVGFTIIKQSGANALQVSDDVRAQLNKLKAILPAGAVVHVTNDTSVFTRHALEAIQKDLVLAVLLVAFVMLLFLHEWKHTVIVLLAIPTSLISTFLVMYALGFTLNVVTLLALALMIGILVDDSIVVLENIHRHLQAGESPWQAALKGRNEIGMAAIAITLADVVVYLPIAFLSGNIGQLFRQYALTVAVATLFSLLIGFTLTPMLASRWLNHDTGQKGLLAAFGRKWDAGFNAIGRFVAHSIPITVRARWLVVLVSICAVGAAASMVPLRLIGVEYAPQEDDSQFQASLSMPPGTTLATTDAAARQFETLMMERIPEIKDVFTSVSAGGGGGFGGGGGRASFTVQTVEKEHRTRSVTEMTQVVRQIGREIPGAQVGANVAAPLGGGFGGGGLSVQIRGPEIATLNEIAELVRSATSGVEGLVDFRSAAEQASPEMRVVMDHTRMSQMGVTAQQVSQALRIAVSGASVGELRPTGKVQQTITLIASPRDRADINNLLNVPVGGGQNGAPLVTLGQVATVTQASGPLEIRRVDRNRNISLQGQIVNRPLGDVVNDVRPILASLELPAGYQVVLGSQVNQLNSAISALTSALLMSLVLEYMLLVALYESWFYPLVRMFAVPLGLVGAFIGLYVTGNTLNIFSIIGLIMAEGLVAKNGILLIDYTNTLRERGMSRMQALQEAARVRLRPIVMTSATLVFGLMPLALKLESGAESRAPTAVVIIGAILSSTLLTLGVIPAVYTLFDDLQERLARRKPQPVVEGLPRGVAVATAEVGAGSLAVESVDADGVAQVAAGESSGRGRWMRRLLNR